MQFRSLAIVMSHVGKFKRVSLKLGCRLPVLRNVTRKVPVSLKILGFPGYAHRISNKDGIYVLTYTQLALSPQSRPVTFFPCLTHPILFFPVVQIQV